jgi:predicted dehydrogenase
MSFKMAVIGYGGMAGWHHQNLREHAQDIGIELVAGYDIREEARSNLIQNGLKSYDSVDELYSDKAIDLVLIATPNDFHKPYAIACLQAGKNVISEKPVTLNAAELEDILAVSKSTGKFFTVHQNRRWDNDYLTMRNAIETGLIKRPHTIESRVQGSRGSLHGWRGYKANGGGMVLDWGVHLIDQMLDFLPEKLICVDAHLHQVFSPEVDDTFTAMFRFESGLTYIVNIAMNCFIVQPRWHVCSEDGTLLIENWELDGKIVKLADSETMEWAEDIVYTAAGPTRSMAPRPKETTLELPLPVVKRDWLDYYRNIADTLAGKAELIVTPAQMLRVMRTIDLVFESNEKKTANSCAL